MAFCMCSACTCMYMFITHECITERLWFAMIRCHSLLSLNFFFIFFLFFFILPLFKGGVIQGGG